MSGYRTNFQIVKFGVSILFVQINSFLWKIFAHDILSEVWLRCSVKVLAWNRPMVNVLVTEHRVYW